MTVYRTLLSALIMAPLVASCVGREVPPYQSAKSEALLGQRLAGTVVGAPVECLSTNRAGRMEVIDADTILYDDGATIYRQDTSGSCYPNGIQSSYTLVAKGAHRGGQLCDGDVLQAVDSSSGFFAASCSFNAFIPYRRR